MYKYQCFKAFKTSGDDEGMFVNGLFSGARASTDNFTAYINPYLVVSKGGNYTKHIYIGSQRIVSKLGDLDSYGQDPRRIAYAGSEVDGASIDFAGKYTQSQQTVKDRYADFEVPYNGKDNDDYVNGQGFCCDDTPLRSAQANDNPELFQYYYHSDHLGSTSLITNLDGEVVQHVEYVPFGEVFIEERNNKWNTPYLFNAKELDEETRLYYYGSRYYDPRISIWLSTDPMQEKYPNVATYAYCAQNPIRYIDPTGRDVKPVDEESLIMIQNTLTKEDIPYVRLDKNGLIDKDYLNSHTSESGNYNALSELVNSDIIINVDIVKKNKDISYMDNQGNMQAMGMPYSDIIPEFADPDGLTSDGVSTGETGRQGITLLPGQGTSGVNSPNGEIYVYVNGQFSDAAKAEIYSHEANGHARIYAQTRSRTAAAHDFKGSKDHNTPLVNAIKTSKQETIKNMKSR